MNPNASLRGLRLPATVITLGAFLLFQVQPLLAKQILPWFGGSAAVWTACMLCFQALLLAGYGYAHVLQHLSQKAQARVHMGMLILSLLVLPILPNPMWRPQEAGDPTFRILGLLLATVGLPYLMLSTTSPLMQAWMARQRPGWQPYRLFALSNTGSLVALLSFPLVVEPVLRLGVQAWAWSGAYALYAIGALVVTWRCRHLEPLPTLATEGDAAPLVGWGRRLFWVGLAFAPSLLLIAGTAHLSTNVAPIPFLWVAPLALYLVSFILSFDHPRWAKRGVWFSLLVPALIGMALLLEPEYQHVQVRLQVAVMLIGIFTVSMVCHGELARLRPGPRQLTGFYLALALGGALGGVFAGLVAPRVFKTLLELPLALAAAAGLAFVAWMWDPAAGGRRVGRYTVASLLALGVLAMGVAVRRYTHSQAESILASARNFYGALRVKQEGEGREQMRLLLHGTINHGGAFTDPTRAQAPISYYGPDSGVGLTLRTLGQAGPLKAGIIGLGSGSLLSYARPQDQWTVYEINPLVVTLARTWFLNLERVKPRLVMGDARLCLENAKGPEGYDVLAVDAFSSDAIPVHLLTREAFDQYKRHLRPGGILAVHISNRYLDLVPVLREEAAAGGWFARLVEDEEDEEEGTYGSDWVLMSREQGFLLRPELSSAGPLESPRKVHRWTDDFSNLYRILK
jgi:SAM-dependent methyltransferase